MKLRPNGLKTHDMTSLYENMIAEGAVWGCLQIRDYILLCHISFDDVHEFVVQHSEAKLFSPESSPTVSILT